MLYCVIQKFYKIKKGGIFVSKLSKKGRIFSVLLAALMATSILPFQAAASDNDSAEQTDEVLFVKAKTYYQYYNEHSGDVSPIVDVPLNYVDAADGAEASVESFEGKDDIIVWNNEFGRLNFTVDVPETGLYSLKMSYFQITGDASTTEFSVLINDESPYDSASRINIPRIWKSKHDITVDSKDNEIRPPQVEAPTWTSTSFKDEDGLFNDPLKFYLEEGEQNISIVSERAMVAIESISIFNENEVAAYVKPITVDLNANEGAEIIDIQGEDYAYTNSQSLFPTYSRGEHHLVPSHPVKQRYNTVGDGTWERSGQTITWNFVAQTAGYYKLNIKGRQNSLRGLYSNRRIYIDGVVPSEPFEQVKFYYDTNFESVVPTDEAGDDAYFYLEAGEHTISLEAIPGEIGASMSIIDNIVYEANQLYMKILMITGPTPDIYTDYYVHEEIPELLDTFQILSDNLKAERKKIDVLSQSNGSEAATLDRLADILDKCIDKPNRIPKYLQSLKDNITAVSSWAKVYRTQPLEIDYMEIASADAEFTSAKSNFFKSLAFGTQALFGSFFEDYTMLSDLSEESINVWVGIGRDQTNVVKQLTESQFIPEYDIPVSVNLVQGAIMEAVLAGKGPDVALFIGGEFPINLAIRGLIQPLSDHEDFDEVASRFQ